MRRKLGKKNLARGLETKSSDTQNMLLLLESFVALIRAVLYKLRRSSLTAESVEGSALSFQSVDDVHSSDGLPLGVLGVGYGITNDVLQKYLEHSSGFFVDET